MPVQLTYPGVYVEEIPSGVRTVTGVSTSVTAFVGSAKRGPVNKAIRVQGYSEFERRFGGLEKDSMMSYAVRQFFLNGGSEAWIVRLAKNALAASREIENSSGAPVLRLKALEEGKTGNYIEARVDHNTSNPASTFNMTIQYNPPDDGSTAITERFENLSMNRKDPRYAPDILESSDLIRCSSLITDAMILALKEGTSVSGPHANVSKVLDPSHNQIKISVNGLSPVAIELALPADAANLAALCGSIQKYVRALADGEVAYEQFVCAPLGSDRIQMISGLTGEESRVRVLPGEKNDASVRLKLGTQNGGVESDAAAVLRPREIPEHGKLIGKILQEPLKVPDASNTSILISLDGYGPDEISIGESPAAGADLQSKLSDIAARLTAEVRETKPSNPAYSNFTCTVLQTNQLLLASGTRGKGSSVIVSPPGEKSIAEDLGFIGAPISRGENVMLQGGDEQPYKSSEGYNLFIGSRDQRKGIYALESVDLFNLLCLPGVADGGILSDAEAYCRERRAFLIMDCSVGDSTPQKMEQAASGPVLPKSDCAAVYYPWVKIADPLSEGKLLLVPPSGTIAGLYARTDSSRGVWKTPAGTDARLVGVQGVDYLLTDRENGTLNPLGVNCIRIFPVYGPVAWGGRTTKGADMMASEYKYVSVRRLAHYIEESLFRGLKWVVFEPNDEPLWAQIRLNAGSFMHNLFIQGAFQGKTPREAYFVRCDKETTTQNDIDRGVVNVVVGFAPLKPAEFVVLKIQQMAGQIQT